MHKVGSVVCCVHAQQSACTCGSLARSELLIMIASTLAIDAPYTMVRASRLRSGLCLPSIFCAAMSPMALHNE